MIVDLEKSYTFLNNTALMFTGLACLDNVQFSSLLF